MKKIFLDINPIIVIIFSYQMEPQSATIVRALRMYTRIRMDPKRCKFGTNV